METVKLAVALVPASLLLYGSILLFRAKHSMPAVLQLLGSAFLIIVVLTHVGEALHIFGWMGWGAGQSVGHYLDLLSAVLGLTLFPIGYCLHALTLRKPDRVRALAGEK